jgi:hypothetical protein
MVEIASRKPVMVFRVLDWDGRAIGQVIQPTASPLVGLGARTVLLVRGEQAGEKLLRN